MSIRVVEEQVLLIVAKSARGFCLASSRSIVVLRVSAFMTELVSNFFFSGLVIMDLGETKMRFLNLGLIEIPTRVGRILWLFRKKTEEVNVPLVLFDRRRNSNAFLAIISLEFSFRGDLELIGVALGFENVYIKETIDQEMIDLGNLPFMLKP